MSVESRNFSILKQENPIASELLVFLRHHCPENMIDEKGFVLLKDIKQELKYSSEQILDSIRDFNKKRSRHQQFSVDDDGKGNIIVKANSSHSIEKVIAYEMYYPRKNEYGYIFFRKDSYYNEGDDLFPSGDRNDVILRFPKFKPSGRYVKINLYNLSAERILHNCDDTGLSVRSNIPSKYIEYHA
jgi:hypothetical protein